MLLGVEITLIKDGLGHLLHHLPHLVGVVFRTGHDKCRGMLFVHPSRLHVVQVDVVLADGDVLALIGHGLSIFTLTHVVAVRYPV